MEQFSEFSKRPGAFLLRYVRRRWPAHAFIISAVMLAVACSILTQYAVKLLVDVLSSPRDPSDGVWPAFGTLIVLIAGDNLLWRLASWTSNATFVAVTGDVRRDLFRYLTGHAPGFFASRAPGTLTSRVTATSNAFFTVENMMVWNVLPPVLATVFSIGLVATVSPAMSAMLVVIAGAVIVFMFHAAASGRPLHHEFAHRAAAVDGEMIDVVGNMPIVRAFGGLLREHQRFDVTIEEEMRARQRSLRYLERLRIIHGLVTVVMTVGLLGWVLRLWQQERATTGDVILVCTLGLSVMHATRDLSVALVDVTQHLARFAEALETLLIPHGMNDRPGARDLAQRGVGVKFDHVAFAYPDCPKLFEDLTFEIQNGERVGLVGPSGGGKSSIFALIQRFYDIEHGRILIGDENVAEVTQQSLRQAIALVPQDITLFHRSLLENIRYARPDASDAEVCFATEAARCDFVRDLPQGLATIVGDRGARLSGGQRQRIALARAFLKNAPLMLLDEATSALDVQSEEAIREALSRLMRGRTVIAIAHRLSTLRQFNRILVVAGGRIVQDGSPELLARQPGLYRDAIEAELRRRDRSPEAA